MRYVRVIVGVPLLKFFDYSLPENLISQVETGSLVLVPFGRRTLTGIVLEFVDEPDFSPEKIKPVVDVLRDYSFIEPKLVELIRWVAEFYISGYGEALRLLYPNGIEIQSYRWISLLNTPSEDSYRKNSAKYKIVKALSRRPYTYSDLKKIAGRNCSKALSEMADEGIVNIETRLHQPRVKPKTITIFNARKGKEDGLKGRQLELYRLLLEKPLSYPEIKEKTGISRSVVDNLLRKELVEKAEKEIFRGYEFSYVENETAFSLNSHQRTAVSAVISSVKKEEFKIYLLHGVTGSGKTQVYIEIIDHVLKRDKGVICLIPEISLTPQTVSRFQGRFGDKIAVLHSKLSDGERFDMWRRVGEGEIKLVVGPRSALFAPVKNIGLIIIDEEHEHTYKQNEGRPLYQARSAAAVRAKLSGIPLLLGSATPAVETHYNAVNGKYELLKLPNRAAAEMQMPKVTVVDLKKTRNRGAEENIVSEILKDKIESRLYAGEQILLLQNRRGFSAFLECPDCGRVFECPHCAVSLSYHRFDNKLRCHFCGYEEKVPEVCPKCGSENINRKGTGTQKVEEILNELFPHARVARMDYDTTAKKYGHEKILNRFSAGEIDILVGTQMIAKGLDFPRVTLVGVILADVGLFMPDFRSAERTFHLLTQVSGRSGRGDIPGEVVIQTYNPEHPILKDVQNQDYQSFYSREIRGRKALGYPPFRWLALIRAESGQEIGGLQVLSRVRDFIARYGKKDAVEILGPAPSTFQKIKDLFRWQLLVKVDLNSDHRAFHTRNLLRTIYSDQNSFTGGKAKLIIDVDPHWLL